MITVYQTIPHWTTIRFIEKHMNAARDAAKGKIIDNIALSEYKKVAKVFTNDLEEAWESTTHTPKGDWVDNDNVQVLAEDKTILGTTNVGDVLQHGSRFYMVLDIGFKEFQPIDVAKPGSVVLGTQQYIPSNGVVLGGIEGLKQRLRKTNSEEEQIKIANQALTYPNGIEIAVSIVRSLLLNKKEKEELSKIREKVSKDLLLHTWRSLSSEERQAITIICKV